MSTLSLRDRISAELGRIPDTRLSEVFDLLHFYRLGLESTKTSNQESALTYAGAWQDMNAKTFEEFSNEVSTRRQEAFSTRMKRDGHAN